jgi:hypothetical protein
MLGNVSHYRRVGRRIILMMALAGTFLLHSQFFIAEASSNTTEACPESESKPERAGWVEQAIIFPNSIQLPAKLDTGAESASLHAENVSLFSREKEDWVTFNITDPKGEKHTFEQKVHRLVKIKRHGQEPAERPVILLDICLGGHLKKTEVNLADRSNYDYPLLIGRVFLGGHFLIDASATDLLTSDCSAHSSP